MPGTPWGKQATAAAAAVSFSERGEWARAPRRRRVAAAAGGEK